MSLFFSSGKAIILIMVWTQKWMDHRGKHVFYCNEKSYVSEWFGIFDSNLTPITATFAWAHTQLAKRWPYWILTLAFVLHFPAWGPLQIHTSYCNFEHCAKKGITWIHRYLNPDLTWPLTLSPSAIIPHLYPAIFFRCEVRFKSAPLTSTIDCALYPEGHNLKLSDIWPNLTSHLMSNKPSLHTCSPQ